MGVQKSSRAVRQAPQVAPRPRASKASQSAVRERMRAAEPVSRLPVVTWPDREGRWRRVEDVVADPSLL